MAKRITAHTIVLFRQGKRISVKPGTLVDLSDAELADINKNAPDALRKPSAEAEVVEVKLPAADTPAKPAAGSKKDKTDPQPQKGGETPPAPTGDDL
jgi:hypothetical protein